MSSVTSAMLDGLVRAGGWGFSLAALGFVLFALWLAFSRFGRIRLGATTSGRRSARSPGSR
jgi:choline-glycine betaine transporter